MQSNSINAINTFDERGTERDGFVLLNLDVGAVLADPEMGPVTGSNAGMANGLSHRQRHGHQCGSLGRW